MPWSRRLSTCFGAWPHWAHPSRPFMGPICSKIVPVFKAGNKNILNNYRPISILPAFSQILEKLASIRLINFLESQDILYKHQYGFRQQYSTIHPILHLLNDISNANDNKSKYITLAIFSRHVKGI